MVKNIDIFCKITVGIICQIFQEIGMNDSDTFKKYDWQVKFPHYLYRIRHK